MGGPRSAELAARYGDGLIATSPDAGYVKTFEAAGGQGKPRYGGVTVCWARDEAEARRTAHRVWPTAGPDPARHVEAIMKYAEAGFDHVGVHQVGPDQDGFFRFYADEVLPLLTRRQGEQRRAAA